MNKKILVMGAGFLGKNIMNEFKNNNYDVLGTTKSEENSDLIKMDITNEFQQNISRIKPEIIINCIANTNVDYLEKNPKIAFKTNTNPIKKLSQICKQENIRLVHISTDSVFDGKKGNYVENDLPNPINVYAESKLKAEKIIQNICNDYVIIRTNFYGLDGKRRFLFEKIYQQLKNGENIIGFDDIIFSPLEIKNLSRMILEITENNYSGILHLASDEFFSKYQFCCSIAKIFGFDKNLIKKGSSDELNFEAKRPKNTTLNNNRSKKFIETKITKFEEWMLRLKNSKVEI